MATNLLWYVLAGFLLGFASSTLWEWFYFRKERLKLTDRRIRELEAKLQEAEIETDKSPDSPLTPSPVPTVAAVTAATRTSAWSDTAYRSPGVFLESEEFEADGDANAAMAKERAQPVPSVATQSATTPPTTLPAAVNPPATVAPANNFVPNTSAPASTTPAATASQESPFAPPRTEQQSPAEALRAKRIVANRTRQEVLAALRRNSEAVERGEQLPSAEGGPALPTATVGPGEILNKEPQVGLGEIPRNELFFGPGEIPAPEKPAAEAQKPILSAARQRWFNKPELTQPSKEYPDDLSKIKGIGDVYKQRLYRAGIYTWKQIAEADSDTLRRATSAYPSSNVEEWHGQAQKLMEKFGRKDAVYHGPHPDDMTKILGIGPVGAAVLYRAGICTYEQLASTPIADLQALFPIAVAGDQPDFDQWVGRSTALADEKHSET